MILGSRRNVRIRTNNLTPKSLATIKNIHAKTTVLLESLCTKSGGSVGWRGSAAEDSLGEDRKNKGGSASPEEVHTDEPARPTFEKLAIHEQVG